MHSLLTAKRMWYFIYMESYTQRGDFKTLKTSILTYQVLGGTHQKNTLAFSHWTPLPRIHAHTVATHTCTHTCRAYMHTHLLRIRAHTHACAPSGTPSLASRPPPHTLSLSHTHTHLPSSLSPLLLPCLPLHAAYTRLCGGCCGTSQGSFKSFVRRQSARSSCWTKTQNLPIRAHSLCSVYTSTQNTRLLTLYTLACMRAGMCMSQSSQTQQQAGPRWGGEDDEWVVNLITVCSSIRMCALSHS